MKRELHLTDPKMNAELIDRIRASIFSKGEAITRGVGINKSAEELMAAAAPERYAEGKAKQARMVKELLPFLEEKKIKFLQPSTQGVLFVDGRQRLTMSIGIDDDQYNMELYDMDKLLSNAVLLPDLGYNPRKTFSNVEELKTDILLLLDWPPSKKCAICNKTVDIKRCSGRKKVWYCSIDHQVAHWLSHKTFCVKEESDA